ncbi:MAG: EAL domain-containing protein [Gammaproteobacteria bacterium]|nr:MAG: EAL domain-containing protein [Gammaproteobacteria bacterium]
MSLAAVALRAPEPATKLLLVDDDAVDRMTCRRALTRHMSGEFELIEADTGEEGLRLVRTEKPHCILLDYKLPDLNGLEFLEQLSKAENGRLPPIVMLTGTDDATVAVEAMKRGARDYLVKQADQPGVELIPAVVRRVLREQDMMEEKLQLEDELRRAGERYRNIVEQIPVITYVMALDEFGTLLYISPQIRVLGYSADEWLVSPQRRLDQIHHADRIGFLQKLAASRADGADFSCEYRLLARSGFARWFRDNASIVRDESGKPLYLEGVMMDISENKRVEEELLAHSSRLEKLVAARTTELEQANERLRQELAERMQAQAHLDYIAYHDHLTGLPNRLLFCDRLEHAMSQANRREQFVALFLLDLDHFKQVNDSLGHSMGDVLLKDVAQRLKSCVRESDTVARLGGDEFAIVLEGLSHIDEAAGIAQKIVDTFAQPIGVDGHELLVSMSIGITIYPFDDDNIEDLMRDADTALYRAKDTGRNGYQFYQADMTTATMEHLSLRTELHHALAREEFVLHYQPVVNLRSGDICGVEALLRWRHPTRGLVSPGEFIPVLEQTGLIVPATEWTLRQGCREFAAVQALGVPSLHLAANIGVNVFNRRMRKPEFTRTLARILEETGVKPGNLTLEITESTLMEDTENARLTLGELKALGVHIAIDDFGVGYSSLSYLRRFPIDVLKIDREFIREIGVKPDATSLVRSIVEMGHTLAMTVVAEGVETAEQLRILRECGCDQMQGFLFSKPLPLDALRQLLKEGRRLSS